MSVILFIFLHLISGAPGILTSLPLPHQYWEYRHMLAHGLLFFFPFVNVGAKNMNSDPQAFGASSLFTEPSP